MSIFDEREVEAGHHRLASTISAQVEVLVASADLVRKALLHQDIVRSDPEEHADYLAVSQQFGFRLVNDIGAATKLLDSGYFVQNERFRLFSDYGTHPSPTSIIAHHDGIRFHIGPHVNEQLYMTTYSDLANLTWHTTDACGDTYFSIFNVSAADLYPTETQRFIESWNGIAPPLGP